MNLDFPLIAFTSDLFAVDPREDEASNPFRYGRELAHWLRERFLALGYEAEEAEPDSCYWEVTLSREWGYLAIACVNEWGELMETVSPQDKDRFVPDGGALVWQAGVIAETPSWSLNSGWRKVEKAKQQDAAQKAHADLLAILQAEPRIRILAEDRR